jgi:enterochelin esterase-like enzyme
MHSLPLLMSFALFTGIPQSRVFLVSDLWEWNPIQVAMQEISPGLYQTEIEAPLQPSLQYKFVSDGQWLTDPTNPHSVGDGQGGFNSVRAVPGFSEDPRTILDPTLAKPRVEIFWLSDRLGGAHKVTTVVPANWSVGMETRVVYFQDGQDYLDQAGALEILSHLSASGLVQWIGIFVSPNNRSIEYALGPQSDEYGAEFALRIVPRVESRLGLTQITRDHRILMGESLGGLISVAIAIRYPQLFGKVGAQSGAFQRARGLIYRQIAGASPAMKLRLEVGTYEPDGFLEATQELGLQAQAAGMDVEWVAFPGVHDWVAWRNRLGDLLLRLSK